MSSRKQTHSRTRRTRQQRKSRKQQTRQQTRRHRQQRGGNIPYSLKTNVPDHLQWSSPYDAAPPAQLNGGLYTEQATGPWGAIPVVPTTTNLITNNLKSADYVTNNSLVQFPGTNRLGNNFKAMPGINWYVDANPDVKHSILCSTAPEPLSTGGKRRQQRNQRRQRTQQQ